MIDVAYVEKYRPKTVDEVLLPERLKGIFTGFVHKGTIPNNLLLTGSAGVGKTSIAEATVHELNGSLYKINGSLEGNIDTLRTDIKNFASVGSIGNRRKYVLLDEADYLTHAMQPALRNFMETHARNCTFILTCNYKENIIPEIISRCMVIDFALSPEERGVMAKQIFARLQEILDLEHVEYSKEVLKKTILKYFPDFRKILNEVQGHIVDGRVDVSILNDHGDINFQTLLSAIQAKDFSRISQWAIDNTSSNTADLYTKLYKNIQKVVTQRTLPNAVIIINDHIYKSRFVVNQEINLIACIAQLMIECEFIGQ